MFVSYVEGTWLTEITIRSMPSGTFGNMKTVYLLATPDDRVYTIYDPTGHQLVHHPEENGTESNSQRWVLTAKR